MMNKLDGKPSPTSPFEIIPKIIKGNDSLKCKHQ